MHCISNHDILKLLYTLTYFSGYIINLFSEHFHNYIAKP